MTRRLFTLAARPEFWLACLLAWLLLSAGRSLGTPWARAALTELLRWSAGVGLALTVGRTLRRAEWGAQLATLLAGLMALAGVWDGLQPGRGGLVGPYHDHQLYGSALLILLPIPVALGLTARDPAWRWGGLAVAACSAACLILSETRSAWAGGLAASLVFAGLWLFRFGHTNWIRRNGRQVLIPLLLVLGAAGVFWLMADVGLRAPMTQRAGTLAALDTDGSWQGRLADWHGAARLIQTHPLAGIGLGLYPTRQSAWSGKGGAIGPDVRPSLSEEAHSFYLQTAAEIGVIGLGLYGAALLAFTGQTLRKLRKSRGRRSSGRAALRIALLSMVAGQAVDALASPSWQFAETSLLFWGLLGVGLAALRRPEPEEAFVPTPKRHFWRHAASGCAAVALAVNLLPVGLLTPVEAYSPPTTWNSAPTSTTINGLPATASVGQTVRFTLNSTYKDGSGNTHAVNVSNDSTAAYAAVIAPGDTVSAGTPMSYPAGKYVTYTVPPGVSGKTLAIFGSFYSKGLKCNASPTGSLKIN